SGMAHREAPLHLHGLYALRLGKKTRVTLSAGPSIFNTTQDLLKSVEFTILPGFTSLRFDNAITVREQRTVAGFNVGANFTWTVASRVGVGTIIRYSRAHLTLDPGTTTALARGIESHPGGLHVGGGLRLLL